MDDPRRYFGLHTVHMLRELIRKWWQVDIGLADASGHPVDQTWGALHAQTISSIGNDFCRLLLSAAPGRKRCLSSLREIHRRLRRDPETGTPVVHSCHLGLQMTACPVHAGGRYRGFVFACGYSSRELSRTRVARLKGTVGDILSRRSSPQGERVPVLGREDVERMKDLLAYGAGEMAAFAQELSRRDSAETTTAPGAFEGIVGRSAPMADALARLRKLAPQTVPVLLVGEPGTGKQALAQALHAASPRKGGPFRVFEESLDPQAAELKLFGQVRGGSLGKVGILESAHGGTVYLCAGSWQSPAVQVKLLRLMQEGSLVPLGAQRSVEPDVRLVLGLERDCDLEISEGRLRRDLGGWLAPTTVEIPPLRERKEDLAPLIDLIVRRVAPPETAPTLHAGALAVLQRYHWPGNVTELEEEIRSLLSLSSSDDQLSAERVSSHIRESAGLGSGTLGRALKDTRSLKRAIEILERELIHEGLVRTRGNKSLLARQLGISRSGLLVKVEKYKLDWPPSTED